MTAFRPIRPIALVGIEPKAPATGRPELTLIAPGDVLVDERYQRNLSERSLDLIRRIVSEFDWRRWRPPVCVWTDEGLTAIDGQHSLVAAASHPLIRDVPVLVVEAETLEERAATFIGINADRLAVTKTQMHVAAVVAGDRTALRVQALCDRLGIRVLKGNPNSRKAYAPRDTVAVSGIARLIAEHGDDVAETVVRVLAEAECAPIRDAALKAVEHLITDPEFAGQIEPADLTAAIVATREYGEKEARLFAATHCVAFWRGLAATWFKKARKARPKVVDPTPLHTESPSVRPPDNVPSRAPAASASRPISPQARVIDRRPVSHVVPLGEPGPGRSALDQRRATR